MSPPINRRPHDPRAHTPNARAIREQRRQYHRYAGSTTTRAHWLNELLVARALVLGAVPGRPYPLGKEASRRLLHAAQRAHRASRPNARQYLSTPFTFSYRLAA